MAEEDLEDPTVSAVVTVYSKEERAAEMPESGVPLSDDLRAVGLAKSRFTSAGFEVHAPFTGMFSIGGKRSLFESFFGETIKVDDSQLIRTITTASGSYDLPIEKLPEDLQGLVRSIAFPPPPNFAGFGG
ncbi:MAG: hypothetical protein ABR540_21205 [Acidimicrobiales bacterium]|nr:hypothetical protein [Actinomycetota bacterium]